MIDEILEAWRTNQRINLKLIQEISKEGMLCTLSKRGGRNVVRQFAHLQNVRVYQLKKRAKPLAAGAHTFESKEEPIKKTLIRALDDSAQRIERWFRLAAEGDESVRTFKRGLVSTLSYLIAHESHHRGSILLTLKECGHALDNDSRYAIWAWDNI